MSNIDLASAMADAMAGKTPSAERMLGDTKAALNGKTADEIIAAADTIMAQRRAKERAEAIKEIEELIKERDAAKLAAAELAKFEILRARFSQRKDYLGMKQPQIELRVRNGTAKAISARLFRGHALEPGPRGALAEEGFQLLDKRRNRARRGDDVADLAQFIQCLGSGRRAE